MLGKSNGGVSIKGLGLHWLKLISAPSQWIRIISKWIIWLLWVVSPAEFSWTNSWHKVPFALCCYPENLVMRSQLLISPTMPNKLYLPTLITITRRSSICLCRAGAAKNEKMVWYWMMLESQGITIQLCGNTLQWHYPNSCCIVINQYPSCKCFETIYLCPQTSWFVSAYLHQKCSTTGGGGNLKNRKPIGDVDCCKSEMAEQIHWWTDRG